MRVLLITSEWPTSAHPEWGTFVVQQVKFLRQAGVDVDVFPFRGSSHPLNYLSGWKTIQEQLRKNSFDLVHAHFGNSAILALPKKTPLVITLHGSDVKGIVGANGQYTLKGKALNLLSRFAVSQSDEVILVADHLKAHLPKKNYHVVPGGIDLEQFRPIPQKEARSLLGLPQGNPIVFFAANPETPVKRFPLAQSAVNLVKNYLPDLSLLTGGGIPFHKMPLYLNAADVLLLTSLHEGSPTVIKEALACNLPIVSVNVGDIEERIKNTEGNIVCVDDNPETLARDLLVVLQTRNRGNSRNAVLELSEELVAERICEVYRAALRTKS